MLLPKQQVEDVLLQKLSADGQPVKRSSASTMRSSGQQWSSAQRCLATPDGVCRHGDRAEGDTVNFDLQAKP